MKKHFLVMLIAAASCNTATSPESSPASKVDLPSVTNYLTQTWHIIDSSAVVDSVSVVTLHKMTEKDLLKEESAFWFAEIQKADDSIQSAKLKIDIQQGLIRTSNEYGFSLDNAKEELDNYKMSQEGYEEYRRIASTAWDSARYKIPAADTVQPVGYRAACVYRVRSGPYAKTDSATVFLNKDFKAVEKETFFK